MILYITIRILELYFILPFYTQLELYYILPFYTYYIAIYYIIYYKYYHSIRSQNYILYITILYVFYSYILYNIYYILPFYTYYIIYIIQVFFLSAWFLGNVVWYRKQYGIPLLVIPSPPFYAKSLFFHLYYSCLILLVPSILNSYPQFQNKYGINLNILRYKGFNHLSFIGTISKASSFSGIHYFFIWIYRVFLK